MVVSVGTNWWCFCRRSGRRGYGRSWDYWWWCLNNFNGRYRSFVVEYFCTWRTLIWWRGRACFWGRGYLATILVGIFLFIGNRRPSWGSIRFIRCWCVWVARIIPQWGGVLWRDSRRVSSEIFYSFGWCWDRQAFPSFWTKDTYKLFWVNGW